MLIDKLNEIFSGSSDSIFIRDEAFRILDLSDGMEKELHISYIADQEKNRLKLEIDILKGVSYFCLVNNYLKESSYAYGIQVFEKGIDCLKETYFLLKDYSNKNPDYENDILNIKKLYDECFNIYSEYKMSNRTDQVSNINMVIRNNLKDIRNLSIVNWILKHL
jgi:hypothetical protein